MPSLLQKLVEQKKSIVGFPIHEYWLDIGQMEDFQRARQEYQAIFS
jgi:NDP-sugar pyrophosphorylase family protein